MCPPFLTQLRAMSHRVSGPLANLVTAIVQRLRMNKNAKKKCDGVGKLDHHSYFLRHEIDFSSSSFVAIQIVTRNFNNCEDRCQFNTVNWADRLTTWMTYESALSSTHDGQILVFSVRLAFCVRNVIKWELGRLELEGNYYNYLPFRRSV